MATTTRYMMATKAYYKMIDISREIPHLCEIYGEDSRNYRGNWVQKNNGFVDVIFPKRTTHDLTIDQKNYYNGRVLMTKNRYKGIIRIPDAPNFVAIPQEALIVRTKNSVYRLGATQNNGLRTVFKDHSVLKFNVCAVENLMLDRPLVLIYMNNNGSCIPFLTSVVKKIE